MNVAKKKVVQPGDEGRADWIVQALTGLPRAQIRGLFDHGCVRIDGKISREPGRSIKRGAKLEVRYDEHRRYKPKPAPRSRSFDLLHEDEHILVVNKAPGVLTVPSPKKEPYTLVQELGRYVNKGQRIRKRVFVVHRLERDVSGVLVFGKYPGAAAQLKSQFASNTPLRRYDVLVWGTPKPAKGKLARDSRARQPATDESTYEVVRRQGDATLVRVEMDTGGARRIAEFFAQSGTPVVGTRQGSEGKNRSRKKAADKPVEKLAVHASMLEFRHPATGEAMRFDAKPPAQFRGIKKLPN